MRLVLLTWIFKLYMCASQVLDKGIDKGLLDLGTKRPIHKINPIDQFAEGEIQDGNSKTGSNGDWKVMFENGTIITGIGKPPKVWHLVDTEGMDVSAKCNSGKDCTVKEPRGVRQNQIPQGSSGTGQNISATFTVPECFTTQSDL